MRFLQLLTRFSKFLLSYRSFLNRPIGLAALMATYILFGVMSFNQLQVALFPKGMSATNLHVSIKRNEVIGGELIDQVVRPAENIFRSIKGIKKISSSIQNTDVTFNLEVDENEDTGEVSREISQAFDDRMHQFPEGTERPKVSFGSSEDTPVIWLFFSAGNLEHQALKQLLIDEVFPEIMKVDGVGRVEHYLMKGGFRDITLDLEKTISGNVNTSKLVSHLRHSGSKNISVKSIDSDRDLVVKVVPEDLSHTGIRSIQLNESHKLGDIAEFSKQGFTTFNRNLVNGEPGEFIQVYQSADANTYNVSKKVFEKVNELCREYGIGSQILIATHHLLDSAIEELLTSALIGTLGALILLFLFLRRVRLALMVTLSLPFSLGTSLIAQNTMGEDVTILSLIGYILAVGIVVDNCIVIGEALVDRAGDADFNERARKIKMVVSDLALPIVVSTSTTIAIFIPILFMKVNPIEKALMMAVGMPILWSLIGSFILALFVLPVLFLYLYPNGTIDRPSPKWINSLKRGYENLMYWFFSHKLLSIILCLLLIIPGPIMMVQQYKDGSGQFKTDHDMRILVFHLRVREKTDIETVERELKKWLDILSRHKEELSIKSVSFNYTGWYTTVIVSLNPFDPKGRTPEDIKKEIASILPPTLHLAMGEHFNKKVKPQKEDQEKKKAKKERIKIMMMGQNTSSLINKWKDLSSVLEQKEGVLEIEDNNIDKGAVVLSLLPQSRELGFSSSSIAQQVRIYSWNQILLRMEDFWILRIGAGKESTPPLVSLLPMKIRNEKGVQLPLESLVARSSGTSHAKLRRENGMTYMKFSFLVEEGVLEKMKKQLPKISKEAGLKWNHDIGYNLKDREAIIQKEKRYLVLMFSILLVYLIMGILYESLLAPVSVMMTVPLTLLSVFCWLSISEVQISVMVMLGLIFLTGIVVNNGIVLVDRLSKEMPMANVSSTPECWSILAKAARQRLIPVLLTSLTTISGGIAMSIGEAKILGLSVDDLGLTMSIGLCGATIFTLFIVPLVYLYLAHSMLFTKWLIQKAIRLLSLKWLYFNKA